MNSIELTEYEEWKKSNLLMLKNDFSFYKAADFEEYCREQYIPQKKDKYKVYISKEWLGKTIGIEQGEEIVDCDCIFTEDNTKVEFTIRRRSDL